MNSMERNSTSVLYGGAGIVLSALLAVQLLTLPGGDGQGQEAAGGHGQGRVAKTWAYTAANLGEAHNLSTEVVLGRVAGVTPSELVVPMTGEPDDVDRIAMDIVTVDVRKSYKGRPGAQVSLLHTRGIRDVQDGDDRTKTAPPPDKDADPDVKGALTDDPPYVAGEEYVLFLRPGRSLPDSAASKGGGPTKVILAPEGRYLVSAGALRPMSDRTFSASLAGKTLAEFERELISLDNDGDGVADVQDNCPAFANPAQDLPAWSIPADDPDCDGFSTRADNFTDRLPLVGCSATSAASDERRDAWPADLNDDQIVDGLDFEILRPSIGTRAGSEASRSSGENYVSRHDLNADLTVDSADLELLKSFSGQTCR